MTNSLIPLRLQFFAVVTSIFLLVGIIMLIRKGKLKEGYSILWFITGLGFFLMAVWTDLLRFFSKMVGVDYEPAMLFAVLLMGMIVIMIHFTVLLSGIDKKDKTLAQYIGLLMYEINRLKDQNEKMSQQLSSDKSQ